MKIEWENIDPIDFEKICYSLLEKDGFTDLNWHGKGGGDKGRDLTAKKIIHPLAGFSEISTWVVQYKRYTSSPPTKDTLASFFNTAREHNPDNVLMILTNTLTSNTQDWLDAVRDNYKFGIYIWGELQLETLAQKYRRDLIEVYPEIFCRGPAIEIYSVDYDEYAFGIDINEFEVKLVAFNCDDRHEAFRRVIKFVQHLKVHEIDFPSLEG